MLPKFIAGQTVTAIASTARTMPGDEVRIVRVLREVHGGQFRGFSYGVVAPDLGITVPFKMFESQLD